VGSLSAHDRLVRQIPGTLAGMLGLSVANLRVRQAIPSGADLVIDAGQTFVVEFKTSASAAPIVAATKQVLAYAKRVHRRAVPLVAVSFMGEVGSRICGDAGVSWIDLSGNAHIIAPGLRVIIEGKPNRFIVPGRPTNLFAPTSSRVVRWLLIHADQSLSQRVVARSTGLDEGFVSRLVARLENDGYLVRDDHGAIRAKDPALLLDAWREAYQFSKHILHQGHVAARSGDALLRFASDTLAAQGIEHAATGLAAAWALTRFAGFRIATLYLSTDPSPTLFEQLGCREDPRGANLWLVVPNDAGVFHGAIEKDGIRCVHPVQVYVDLKSHPERATEAAEHLRTELLTWRHDG
jgi:hypothetical protein